MKAVSIILILIVCGSCSEWWKPVIPICPASDTVKVTQSSIRLEWTGVGKIDGYRIYRDGKVIAELPPAANYYVDENLKSKTMYIYNVKPYKLDREGDCFETGVTTL